MRNILILIMLTSSLLIACEESSENVNDANIGEEIGEPTEAAKGDENDANIGEEISEPTEAVNGGEDEIVANVEDLEGAMYRNDNGQFIQFKGNTLSTYGSFSYAEYDGKTDIDFMMEAEGYIKGMPLDKNFENIDIQTSGSTYYIKTQEGHELTFEKVGQRIMKDSRGYRYYQAYKE